MYKLDYEIYQIKRTLDVLEIEAKRIEEMSEEQRLEYKLDDRSLRRCLCKCHVST